MVILRFHICIGEQGRKKCTKMASIKKTARVKYYFRYTLVTKLHNSELRKKKG